MELTIVYFKQLKCSPYFMYSVTMYSGRACLQTPYNCTRFLCFNILHSISSILLFCECFHSHTSQPYVALSYWKVLCQTTVFHYQFQCIPVMLHY